MIPNKWSLDGCFESKIQPHWNSHEFIWIVIDSNWRFRLICILNSSVDLTKQRKKIIMRLCVRVCICFSSWDIIKCSTCIFIEALTNSVDGDKSNKVIWKSKKIWSTFYSANIHSNNMNNRNIVYSRSWNDGIHYTHKERKSHFK